MKIKKDILWRIGIVYIGMVLLSLCILFQMLRLQIFERSEWKDKEAMLKVEDVILVADRGSILSDDGRKLACSVPGYKVFMDSRATGLTGDIFRKKVDSLALCLSRLYGDRSPAGYRQLLVNARQRGLRYFPISDKRLSIIELKKLKQFPIFRMGANKGGLIVETNDSRKLPFGSLAARTIGKFTVERDSIGDKTTRGVGLEKGLNEILEGKDGVGDKTKVGSYWVHDIQVAPVDGLDIITTLNVEIQDAAEQSLREQLIRQNARFGVAIVMEVKTGDIKAMVNLGRSAPGTYVEDHFNYAIGQSTEPGSTFKLPALMVALEDGVVDIDDKVDLENGSTQFYDRVMRDHDEKEHGEITLKEAFSVSSNVGISKVIFQNYKSNPQKFIDGLLDMGLGSRLDIPIPGDVEPLIKTPESKTWSGITLPWMSIGYEVRLTPLQILTFYNAIANDGEMVKPRFVTATARHGNIEDEFDVEVIKSSICSGRTIRKAKELLENVVENGTAMNLKNDHYKIAGKTGTAQVARNNEGYGTKGFRADEGGVAYQASFVGYFPADNPLYSCIVVVNGPSNNVYYGNVVAGSVFKEISDRLYANSYKINDEYKEPGPRLTKAHPYTKGGDKEALEKVLSKLDLNYDDNAETDWVGSKAGADEIELVSKKYGKGLVPNVKGFGATDAVALLEGLGMRVQLSGVGKVVEQSATPGSRIVKGGYVSLRLN